MTSKQLSYVEFFTQLKAKRPDIVNFYVQRQDKPKQHLLHICLELTSGGWWFTTVLDTSQALIDEIPTL